MGRIEVTEEELAETRRLNDLVEQVLASLPSVHTVDPVETRRQRSEGGGVLPAPVRLAQATDRVVHADGLDVPVRLLVPDEVRGAYLHVHGGGWVLGAADEQDERLWAFAQATGLAVVSVDYRLAPEHPFPAGPDDVLAAARWLVAQGGAELGTDRLLIGGESAGAHLAVLALLALRDEGATPFLGANLVFGCYDLSRTPSCRRWGDRNLILSGPIVEWFLDCALPGVDEEARRDPAVSPLYADLTGLPPALLTVGELDPLLDDSTFLAARWEAAANEVQLDLYPESIHAFTGFPTSLARRAEAAQVAFARRCLDAT